MTAEVMIDKKMFRLLLVEDDEDHARIVLRMMPTPSVGTGARGEIDSVKWVKDGVEAIDFLRKTGEFTGAIRPNVILLDLKLPRKSGIEVLKEVKEDPSLATIPVVILTTSDHELDKLNAYKYHANSYLVKPLDFKQFRELISEVRTYWGGLNRSLESANSRGEQ